MRIEFKAKSNPMKLISADGSLYDAEAVKVPKITRNHCYMNEFRSSKSFGKYANSDLFGAILARSLRELGVGKYIDINTESEFITVSDGFLKTVTIDIPDKN